MGLLVAPPGLPFRPHSGLTDICPSCGSSPSPACGAGRRRHSSSPKPHKRLLSGIAVAKSSQRAAVSHQPQRRRHIQLVHRSCPAFPRSSPRKPVIKGGRALGRTLSLSLSLSSFLRPAYQARAVAPRPPPLRRRQSSLPDRTVSMIVGSPL